VTPEVHVRDSQANRKEHSFQGGTTGKRKRPSAPLMEKKGHLNVKKKKNKENKRFPTSKNQSIS